MLQQHRELWRVGGLQNYLHDEGKGVAEKTIFSFSDGMLFRTIQIR